MTSSLHLLSSPPLHHGVEASSLDKKKDLGCIHLCMHCERVPAQSKGRKGEASEASSGDVTSGGEFHVNE